MNWILGNLYLLIPLIRNHSLVYCQTRASACKPAFIDIVYDSITQTDFVIFSLKMMNHMDLQKGVSYMPTIIAVEELGLQSQDLTVCTTVF